MGASVQPLPPIQDALAQIRSQGQSPASPLPPIHQALAQIRQGAIDRPGNIDLRTSADETNVSPLRNVAPLPSGNPLVSIISGVAKGASANFADEIAGAIGALTQGSSYTGDFGKNYTASRADYQRGEQHATAAHPTLSMLSNLAGAALPALATGGTGAATLLDLTGIPASVAEGAAYGGMAGAGAGDGLANRAKRAAGGAALGAAGGAVTGAIGNGITNLADRAGAADLAGKVIEPINPAVASKLGTRGQVNHVLSDRQDILDAIGDDGESAASKQMARIADTKAQAKVLYDAARADQAPIQNARLQTLLADPRIAKSYQSIVGTLDRSENPLPTGTTNTVLSPSRGDDGLLSSNDIAAASSKFDRLYGRPGGPTSALPDPRALSLLKRELYNVAQGKLESPLPLKQTEAQQLLPMVDEIRTQLHTSSPAWRAADQFYSGAKGEEEAFTQGFDAWKSASGVTGKGLTEDSPEAMLKAITEPRYPGEPAEALTARASAFRDGMRSAAAAQVKGAPIDAKLQSVLGVPALSQTGQQTRALMFESPQEASTLEQQLAQLRGTSLSKSGGGGFSSAPINKNSVLRSLYRGVTQPPNLLNTPEGQSLLATRLASPGFLENELSLLNTGGTSGEGLRALLGRVVPGVTNGRNLPTRPDTGAQ